MFRTIQQQLERYEEAVRAQSSGKSRLKHIDLRLCRLCFKTKFADGIGRLCHDCRKRVCQRCGGFTKSRWDPKKKKVGGPLIWCTLKSELFHVNFSCKFFMFVFSLIYILRDQENFLYTVGLWKFLAFHNSI